MNQNNSTTATKQPAVKVVVKKTMYERSMDYVKNMSYLTKIGMINISIDASWGCRGKDGELGCPALIVEATKL